MTLPYLLKHVREENNNPMDDILDSTEEVACFDDETKSYARDFQDLVHYLMEMKPPFRNVASAKVDYHEYHSKMINDSIPKLQIQILESLHHSHDLICHLKSYFDSSQSYISFEEQYSLIYSELNNNESEEDAAESTSLLFCENTVEKFMELQVNESRYCDQLKASRSTSFIRRKIYCFRSIQTTL